MTDNSKLPPIGIVKAISNINVFIYRLTRGRLGGKLSGSPICLVTMKGRKSGKAITKPLMYTPDGEDVLIVASLGGAPRHPLWYHNVMANPDVTIQVGSSIRKMRARQAGPEEKARVWPLCVASYPAFAEYQSKTDRDIPVIICSPA